MHFLLFLLDIFLNANACPPYTTFVDKLIFHLKKELFHLFYMKF